MNESKNFRIALLTGGSNEWSDTIMPLLLARTDCLIASETVDELLSLQPPAKPEMIFICHQPGKNDGITAAEQIRAHFAVTPLVLVAEADLKTLKAAVAVGALAVLEPPFSEPAFISVFNRCCHPAGYLRWNALKQQLNVNRSELFMQSPLCHMFVDSNGMITFLNSAAASIMGIDQSTTPEFSEISRRFFAPHALTYPLEMEMAVSSEAHWNGILAGRLPDSSTRIYRVISTPLTLAEGSSGVILTLHDATKVQTEQARQCIELQAARDCLTMAVASGSNPELMQVYDRTFKASPVQEIFSLNALLDSVKGDAVLTVPDYIPNHFRGDNGQLGYALKSVIVGSAGYGKGALRISLSVKERTPAGMVIRFDICAENSEVTSDSFQSVSHYLISAAATPNALTGLGLTSVLIERMNGSILVRTECGIGRTVCCSVPLLPEADESLPAALDKVSAPSADNGQEPLSSLKILVAEDNLMQQTALRHLLDGIGCRYIVVGNGKEAVDEFEHGEFDVVLMDILMPVMDGFEATRLIRERERITGGKITVVALTSYSLKAIQEKCVSVGMNGYLAKPVAKKNLLEALQRLSKPHDLPVQPTPSSGAEPDLKELPVLDSQSAIENLDFDTYRELVEMYLTGYAELGNQLAEKLDGGDIKDILECAHGLKGMVANIGGLRLAAVADRIQNSCREGVQPDCLVWMPVVKSESLEIKKALEQIDWNVLERFSADK